MHLLANTTVVLAAATGVILASGSAAVANDCPGMEPICVYVHEGTYPLGNPFTGPIVTHTGTVYPGPAVCDSSGTECIRTYVVEPDAKVESTAGTIATVTIPGIGVGVAGRQPTFYVGVPGASLGTVSAGITATFEGEVVPLVVETGPRECIDEPATTVGPVSTETKSCTTTITFTA